MSKTKRTGLLTTSILAAVALHAQASAQATASARSSATIVQGMTITNTSGLHFGALIPGAGGTVTVSTGSVRTATGTITLIATTTFPVSAAKFNLLGAPNMTYSITLPTSTTLTRQGGSDTILITGFVSNPLTVGTLNGSGAGTLAIGGTITVAGSQAAGTYTGQFSVTLTYQ